MNLRVFHEDGKIEIMPKVQNEYHAQNILALLFVVGDENAKNDVVFAELLDSKIFAFRCENGIIIRNATEEFLKECVDLEKEEAQK